MGLTDYLYVDDDLAKVLKRLQKNKHAKVDSKISQSLSRNNVVKGWRDNDYIFFSKDRRKNVSWINVDDLFTLKNKGKKWFF